MTPMISLEFSFHGKTYYALVRSKRQGTKTQHAITVMNGDLEKMLYGNHIITEENGFVREQDDYAMAPEVMELKQTIVDVFCQHTHLSYSNLLQVRA